MVSSLSPGVKDAGLSDRSRLKTGWWLITRFVVVTAHCRAARLCARPDDRDVAGC